MTYLYNFLEMMFMGMVFGIIAMMGMYAYFYLIASKNKEEE